MRSSRVSWSFLCFSLQSLSLLGCDLTRFEARQCQSDDQEGQDTAEVCADGGAASSEPPTTDEPPSDGGGAASTSDGNDDRSDATPSDDSSDDPSDDGTAADDDTDDTGPSPEAGTPPPPEELFPPIVCDSPSSDHVRAYFEVPRATGADTGDYFRLPFPNDFYLNKGRVSLGDFPQLSAAATALVSAVSEVTDGFSSSPTLLFRFSGKVNFKDSVIPRFHVIDITDPTAPSSPPLKLLYSPQGGKYICHDWLAVRPAPGHPLKPGHTYAAVIDAGVVAANGLDVEPAEHFLAMLADATPSDPVLATLHGKYEALRAYLVSEGKSSADLLNGTVFTVGNMRTPMQELAAQVQSADPPAISEWVRCTENATSPCADTSAGRACGAVKGYEEYHALIALPIFLRGEAPYATQGGQIDTLGVVRTENVCLSLTLPTAAAPAQGYPIAVTAHGAGGSFRSHVRPEVAGVLSKAETPDGEPMPFAVLGYDAVQHGPRRGDVSELPDDAELLLVNAENPLATLGTSLQGAVDVLSVTRAARGLSLPSEVSGRDDVVLDTNHVVFWGQGEGAVYGAVALPYSDDVRAAVFSALGAGFIQTQLRRTKPVSVRRSIADAFADPGNDGELLFGGEYHPALGLLQQLVDAGDAVNYAELLVSSEQSEPLHVFQVYGTQDTFAPGIAQQSFARAADLAVVHADGSAEPADDLGTEQAALPLSGNATVNDLQFTAGVRQYGPPADTDGHLVAYSVVSAAVDISTFLAMAAHDETPQIGH